MRGIFRDQAQLFSYVSPESRVPSGHPLRKIHGLVRDVLSGLSWSFARLYAKEGRPSVPPEQLLSALLIQALYGIRTVAGRSGVGPDNVHQEPRTPAGGPGI